MTLRRPHRPFRRTARTALAVGAALALTGCASSSRVTDSMAEALAVRGLPVAVADPIQISPEMQQWVRDTVGFVGEPRDRVKRLLDAILNRREDPFVYRRGTTSTARDAWESGRANCLTFSHMYIALAREIQLDVYYLRVFDLASFDHEDDLIVASEHVTAAWGPGGTRMVLDFSDRPVRGYADVERISDLTALALHYSNQGAELVRSGLYAEAKEKLDLSVRIDPELGDGWLNLGVARRRLGDLDGAEEAYRKALEVSPGLSSAYQNLASLLQYRNRPEEAQELVVLAARASSRNPYSLIALGDLALRNERPDEALRYYRRARSLDPENAEVWAALGEWALESGRRSEARRNLKRAIRIEEDNPRVRSLSDRLDGPPSV